MLIRQETSSDFDAVYTIVQEAFATAEHSDGNEQDLVTALRGSAAFIPELSLVAEADGKLAGYIMFTRGSVGAKTVLVLAPLAVLPEYQQHGIGSALIREGHRIAAELGYEYISVLGSETYYPRFGYVPAAQLGIKEPAGIPSANFMALKLRPEAPQLCGSLQYAGEFGL